MAVNSNNLLAFNFSFRIYHIANIISSVFTKLLFSKLSHIKAFTTEGQLLVIKKIFPFLTKILIFLLGVKYLFPILLLQSFIISSILIF